jgi:hypothetical protein
MPLSAEEEKALQDLIAKRDAPEAPAANGPNVEVYIDLSSEEAVERALSFGLLTRGDLDDPRNPKGDDGKPDDDDKTPPKPKPRRGYFKDDDDQAAA